MAQYAVVKESLGKMTFTILHNSLELAKEESARLSCLEKAKFLVLKVVGSYEPKSPPIVWVDARE